MNYQGIDKDNQNLSLVGNQLSIERGNTVNISSLPHQVLTTAQINALTPVLGELIYNSDINMFVYHDGINWKKISHNGTM